MNYILVGKENAGDFENVLFPGFDAEKKRVTIGAYEDDGTVCGAVSVILSDYQYDCDWLYVHPERRRQGIGKGLFEQVMKFISGTGMIFPVSASFEVTPEDDSLYSFFLSMDDVDVEFSHGRYYASHERIAEAPELHKKMNVRLTEKEFGELSDHEKNQVIELITNEHICAIPDLKSFLGNMAPDVSIVVFNEGAIVGGIFFQLRGDQNLELQYLFADSSVATVQLTVSAAARVKDKYPGYGIVFDAVNDKSARLAKKVFKGTEPVNIYEATWG